MINRKIVSTLVATSIAAFGLSQTVSAGGEAPENMREWAKEAGNVIQSSMKFPNAGTRSMNSGVAKFNITVNRDGKLVSYTQEAKPYGVALNTAANNLVKTIDFPELPESYRAENMTFSVALNYSTGRSGAKSSGAVLTTYKEGATSFAEIRN